MAGYSLAALAERTGAELHGEGSVFIERVATLDEAGQGEISFLANERYRQQLAATRASAVIVAPEYLDACHTNALVTASPYLAYASISTLLHPAPVARPGRDPSSVIAATARIHATAEIGPLCVIGEESVIGPGAIIGPACVVQSRVTVGAETRLVARVTLCSDTVLGERCLLHPGVVVGSDGFGLADDHGRWVKVPQLGRVVVGDDVEIGANTTVDRGSLRDTVIAHGVKLDNLIQIAHNVRLGEHTAIAGCTGIAGSTTVGSHCTLGGNTGLAGHLTIGDRVHISGKSLVTRSLQGPGSYSGNLPAMPTSAWRRTIARMRHLDELFRRVKSLEKRLGVDTATDETDDRAR